MKKCFYILLVLGFIQNPFMSFAQDTKAVNDTTCSIKLQTMSEMYYNQEVSLVRNFDYEGLNKVKKLRLQSDLVMSLGAAVCLTEIFIGSAIAINNNWNNWIFIPCNIIVDCAILIPFITWSKKIDKKATELEAEINSKMNIEGSVSIGSLKLQNQSGGNNNGYGVSLTLNF